MKKRTIKEKTESKLSVQVNEDKGNAILKNKTLNNRKKKGCVCTTQRCTKTSTKQKGKQQTAKKSQKTNRELNVSNMYPKHNKEVYDCQIRQLEMFLKQSLNCPTLTQEELKMLFMKYKLDGHYRTNKNLPSFASLLENSHDTNNEKNCTYDQMQHVSSFDVQNTNCSSSGDSSAYLYYDTNDENQHTNLKCDGKPEDTLRPSNIYIEQNSLINNNYNHVSTNYDTQAHCSASVLNNIQNFDESKINLNVYKTSDIEKEHFSQNFMNRQNVLSSTEEYQNFKYANKLLSSNIIDSSAQYDNSNCYRKNSQKNYTYNAMQYNDLNLNLCNDHHSNKYDNHMSLINKNNDFQSWKSEESVCVPYSNNLESYYDIKNVPSQMTLIKNHLEEENSFSSQNVYPLNETENLMYASNNINVNIEQNYNTYRSNSTVLSDATNFLPEANTFVPSCANVIEQYNIV